MAAPKRKSGGNRGGAWSVMMPSVRVGFGRSTFVEALPRAFALLLRSTRGAMVTEPWSELPPDGGSASWIAFSSSGSNRQPVPVRARARAITFFARFVDSRSDRSGEYRDGGRGLSRGGDRYSEPPVVRSERGSGPLSTSESWTCGAVWERRAQVHAVVAGEYGPRA